MRQGTLPLCDSFGRSQDFNSHYDLDHEDSNRGVTGQKCFRLKMSVRHACLPEICFNLKINLVQFGAKNKYFWTRPLELPTCLLFFPQNKTGVHFLLKSAKSLRSDTAEQTKAATKHSSRWWCTTTLCLWKPLYAQMGSKGAMSTAHVSIDWMLGVEILLAKLKVNT